MINKKCPKAVYILVIFFFHIIQILAAEQLKDDRIKFIIDSLSTELKTVNNWHDRKYILENLFDITPVKEDKFNVLRTLLQHAEKEEDTDCQIKTIRELCNTFDIALEDSLIDKIKIIMDKKPDAKSTLIFAQSRRESLVINNYKSADDKYNYITDKLQNALNIDKNESHFDIYDRILVLNNICLYLNLINNNGSIYVQSLEELLNLSNIFPKRTDSSNR
jgi:hypothetical protein